MALFNGARKPEPEVMDESGEVEAYASAAAQAYLDALDNTFVDQIVSLGIDAGVVLDVGAGPGSIPLKIARQCPRLHLVGADRSAAMLQAARASAIKQGLNARVEFILADASRLCFPDQAFDLVISNSLLHHLSEPVEALYELARVTKPGGKVLLRDLRRPPRWAFALHAAWHGRHYSGRMRQLYRDSLRAAYTPAEIQDMLRRSCLGPAKVVLYHRTHIGILWENVIGSPRRA